MPPALLSIDTLLPPAVIRRLEQELDAAAAAGASNKSALTAPSRPITRRAQLTARHGQQLAELLRSCTLVTDALDACVAESAPSAVERVHAVATAQAYKQQGNTAFGRRAFADAVRFYSLGARLAWSDRALAAVCYANRATSLQHLSLLEHALADCEQALRLDPAYDKAWARLAQVQLARGCATQSVDAARRVAVSTPALAKCLQEAMEAVERSSATRPRPADLRLNAAEPPAAVFAAHLSLANTSAAVEMRRSPEAGRFLVAREPIAAGECVVSERAYAAVLRNAFRPRPLEVTAPVAPALPTNLARWRCESCFVPLVLPAALLPTGTPSVPWFISCDSCPAALYCSDACRQTDEDECHALECGLHPLLQRLPEVTRLAVRMATKHARSVRPRTTAAVSTSPADSSVALVDSLLTHLDDLPASVLVEYQLQASIAHALFRHAHARRFGCTAPSSAAAGSPSADGCWHDSVTFERVLRHLCQTRSNVYAITSLQRVCANGVGSASSAHLDPAASIGSMRWEQQRLAVALFPRAAMLNHACKPNVALQFSGRHLSVRTSEALGAGAEILNNYGPHRGHHTRAQRQQALADEYHFICRCHTCEQGEPLRHFRCIRDGCPGELVSSARPARSTSSPDAMACTACGSIAPSDPLLQRQHELEGALDQAREWMGQAQTPRALALVGEVLQRQQRLMTDLHSQLARTFDLLSSCSAQQRRWADAIRYMQRALPVLQGQFGEDSVEVAHERCKLAQLQRGAGDATGAAATVAVALPALRLHYPSDSEVVLEASELLERVSSPA